MLPMLGCCETELKDGEDGALIPVLVSCELAEELRADIWVDKLGSVSPVPAGVALSSLDGCNVADLQAVATLGH